jgi:hypothetical protein
MYFCINDILFSYITKTHNTLFPEILRRYGTNNLTDVPGMTNNAIPLQGILGGKNDQFYHSLTKYNLEEFHFSNAY